MSVALLGAAAWLATPHLGYLVGSLAATAVAVLLGARAREGWTLWPVVPGGLLLLFGALGIAEAARVRRIDRDWDALSRDIVMGGGLALERLLGEGLAEVPRRARRALDAPIDTLGAFTHLQTLSRGTGEYGIVLYRGGRAAAWSGSVRIPVAALSAPIGVVESEFYLVLYAVAQRDDDRAVATLLIEARPPADRLSNPLELLVTSRTGVQDFRFGSAADTTSPGFFRLNSGETVLSGASPEPPVRERVRLATLEAARVRGSVLLAFAVTLFVAVIWRRERSISVRLASLVIPVVCVAIVPLNALSNASRLFDPALYYAEFGGPFTASPGAFALTAGIVLLGVLALLRSPVRIPSRAAAIALVIVIATGGVFLMRNLARGISPPPWGVSTSLWLAWEVALFLVGVSVVLGGATAGRAALHGWRGLPPALAPALAVIAALVGPVVWEIRWHGWYPALWIAAIGALALSRRSRRFMLAASTVAALGAATLVWGNAARKRVELAQRDIAALGVVDPTAELLLRRFGGELTRGGAPESRTAMLRRYASSDLASASFPVSITSWSPNGFPMATLDMLPTGADSSSRRAAAVEAARTGQAVVWEIHGPSGLLLLLAVPHADRSTTTVVVVPRPRAGGDDPFLALLGIGPESAREPPYLLTMTDAAAGAPVRSGATPTWERRGTDLHGDVRLGTGDRALDAHVAVELRPYEAMLQRGALVLLLDLLILGVLWSLAAAADGGLGRWIEARRRAWARSYRARLSLVLFGFFVVPAMVFALWSYRGLQTADRQARELLVRETLRAVEGEAMGDLGAASARFDTPLLLYGPAELARTSDPLYDALAPLGRFLAPDVYDEVVAGDEITTARYARVGPILTLVGYRVTARSGEVTILGAPARADELALDRRRQDLGVLVLFVTAMGALAALWLSGVAGRQLSRPIRVLRGAALAIARGNREPSLSGEPPAEFVPVFAAFRTMAGDLGESRAALEEAQRRTAAILRNVASGVVAVSPDGTVTLANPRADALLGRALPPGTPLAAIGSPVLERHIAGFITREADEEEELDIEIEGRQLHARLTRLTRGGSGAVLTVDDVTELARAQRVLAWGEMARQVAHEIKNPLTPIRLGVQHLKRAHAAGRGDFDRILDQNVSRILAEIDRLDEIARAFSRYGTAPSHQAPAMPLNASEIARDVVALETLGEGGVQWRVHDAGGPAIALASADELREVLLNILENARLAGARRVDVVVQRGADAVSIVVADDGEGIPADVLPRIFEPHFSTRTSGSGLGLAISRRMIEGWGGAISVGSEPGKGTRVEITLVPG